MPEATLSALLPVHEAVDATVFAAAVDSVLTQTRQPDEVVVVEDGPVSAAVASVVASAAARHPAVIRVRLDVNGGAGVANQAGLLAASGTWIAKVDADDISLPARFERQMKVLASSGADVCGTAMLEFDADPATVTAVRVSPLEHDAISRRMRFNNPINHPTAVYRRAIALTCGGYPDLRYMQDYVLFARMLAHGARMMNLAEPLVYFRAGEGVFARRRATGMARLEWRLQQELRECGVVGPMRSAANLVVRVGYRKLPLPMMSLVHRRVLASEANKQ